MKTFFAFCLLAFCAAVSAQEDVQDYLLNKGVSEKSLYAVIIANEDYQSFSNEYTANEELAIYQAERFQHMLITRLGVPQENIIFYTDAVNTHIKLAIAKLQKSIPRNSSIIFYYRGKTFTDTKTGEIYLIPVDVSDNEVFFMFSLKSLCSRLDAINIKSTDILIDCLPSGKSGMNCMIDNGFIKGQIPDQEAKNMALLTLGSSPASATVKPALTGNEQKPEIVITDPLTNVVQTKGYSVIVEGKVVSGCKTEVIAVNGQEAHLREDGSFVARINLNEGENRVAVEARNCAGWTRDYLTFITPVAVKTATTATPADTIITSRIKESGINYAVIIGISKYNNPVMPDLFYPVKDASRVKTVLTSGFTFESKNVLLLENSSGEKIVNTLDSVIKIVTNNDNLFIFYAGHGSWDEKTQTGYWLPADAEPVNFENWLMNSIITGFVSKCNARHTLVIADACFGGSIFRTRAFKSPEEKTVAELYSKTSKKAMTSGDMTEVPDESIFVQNFISLLSENRDDFISSEKIFFTLKPKVMNNSNLIPQFGTIKNAGDDGGDYIFFKKR